MTRGRKPLPSSAKKLGGNAGRRPLNLREPVMPLPATDAAPAELVGDIVALAEWQRLAPLLRTSKTMTDGDSGSLVALCQQWSRYLEATGKIGTAGLVVKAPSGYPMPNPYIGIANKALNNCIKLWAEFGLTPSSRSRVSTTAPGATDPFAEFESPAAVTPPIAGTSKPN